MKSDDIGDVMMCNDVDGVMILDTGKTYATDALRRYPAPSLQRFWSPLMRVLLFPFRRRKRETRMWREDELASDGV